MTVDSANFEVLAVPPIPAWAVRVSVRGTGLLVRTIPIGAEVGSIPVEAIVFDLDGGGFVGYLATKPPDGATLKVGYLDDELTDTGITFNA
jgi:hypothetical protein